VIVVDSTVGCVLGGFSDGQILCTAVGDVVGFNEWLIDVSIVGRLLDRSVGS